MDFTPEAKPTRAQLRALQKLADAGGELPAHRLDAGSSTVVALRERGWTTVAKRVDPKDTYWLGPITFHALTAAGRAALARGSAPLVGAGSKEPVK